MSAPIQAALKRGFLGEIAEAAKRTQTMTLREAIISARSQIYTPNFQRGRILINTSGSGQSGSFEIGVSGKGFTQENVFAMVQEFVELLDATVSAGTPDAPDASTIDALYAAMCADDSMQSVRAQMGDFSLLNA